MGRMLFFIGGGVELVSVCAVWGSMPLSATRSAGPQYDCG